MDVVKWGYGVCAKIQDWLGGDGGASVLQGVRAGGADGAGGVGAQRKGNREVGEKGPRDYQRGAEDVV